LKNVEKNHVLYLAGFVLCIQTNSEVNMATAEADLVHFAYYYELLFTGNTLVADVERNVDYTEDILQYDENTFSISDQGRKYTSFHGYHCTHQCFTTFNK